MTQSFTTHLKDADPKSSATLGIRVTGDHSAISLFPNGYGDYGSADGHGCPVFLELYQGHLRLIVFQDINEQDPIIIDLENARDEKFVSGDEDTGNIITTEFKRINNEEDVKIVIEGGVVQSVECPDDVSVMVRDYDTDGSSDFVTTDEDGKPYIESIWNNEN